MRNSNTSIVTAQTVLDAMQPGGVYLSRDVATATGLSANVVWRVLMRLARGGLVARLGIEPGKPVRWQRLKAPIGDAARHDEHEW